MIRKTYIKYLKQKIKSQGLSSFFKIAQNYIGVWAGYQTNKSLAGPLNVGISLTYACNLKCKMCDIPKRSNKYLNEYNQPILTTDELKKIIDDFAFIGTAGIGFTGGEPMLRKDIFEIISYTNKKNIISQMTSNGWYINEESGRKLIESGLNSISFSLDGSKKEIHDNIRGVSGSYDHVINAIKVMTKLRKEMNADISININSVVSHYNVDDVLEIVKVSREAGADCIGFMPFHDIGILTNNNSTMDGLKMSEKDINKLDKVIDELIKIKKETGFVESSEKYLNMFKRCFRGKPFPINCMAGFTTLHLDGHGNYFPCFPFLEMEIKWENVRDVPIREYWKSNTLKERRKKIKSCRKCYWNCQAETNLLYNFTGINKTK